MRNRGKSNKKTQPISAATIIILFFVIVLFLYSFSKMYGSDQKNDEPETTTRSALEKPDTIIDKIQPEIIEEADESTIIYDPAEPDIEYLIETFAILQNPLPGTVISWKDAHLPGAERPYRKGIHHGLDFYGAESGGGITLGSRVQAAAPGTIVRIDHDYELPPIKELSRLSEKCRELGETPEDILDVFRGRQLWIANEEGFIIRYCHLQDVSDSLNEGDFVEAGQQIATMGYSGTTEPDRPHLHLEIWIGDNYLGKGMSVNQIREFFQNTIFKS